MSLALELERKKTSSRIWIRLLGIIGIGIVLYVLWGYFGAKKTTAVAIIPTEYTIKKGNITLGLTAEGSIKGNNTLSLGFEGSGKVTSIKKNIGDAVKMGEVIATIDDTQAKIDLQKAKNALAQAMANYSIKVHPLSALEKKQIEGTLAMNQISYENTLLGFEKDIETAQKSVKDAQKKLSDYNDDLKSLIGETSNDPGSTNEKNFSIQVTDAYQAIKQNLKTIDEFLGISPAQQSQNANFDYLIAAKDTELKNKAENLWRDINTIEAPAHITLTQDMVDSTLADIQKMRELAALMIDVIDASVDDSSNLTKTMLANLKSSFSSMYTAMSSKYTTVANALESDADSRRNLEQQIAQAKADIDYQNKQIVLKNKEIEQLKRSNEQELANNKIDYNLKIDPLTTDEKELAQLQLESAKISVQEKQIALDKTMLKSPVDGVILTLDGHIGETAPSAFATLATTGYAYVESSVSEDEIGLIKVGQKASITPTAVPDAVFSGEVYFVSTVGDTDNNGIVTYKVFIKYTSDDPRIRTAMNVDISFISKQVTDVLTAPIKAVFPYENTPHVRMKDGTYQSVITGLSDGKLTEIISGVTEGDVVIIQ